MVKSVRSAAIVVNWNSWADLDHCLEALIEQEFPFNRILVIDNNSSEPMPESLRRWQDVENVEFKFLETNVGFAGANNVGLEIVADCHWVALVNPDAFLDIAWHREMRQACVRYPTAASFSSALVKANDPAYWDGLGDVYHISGLVWRNAHGHRRHGLEGMDMQIFSPCAAAAFYRRSSVLEVGGFDVDYFCYVEDVDLGFRLRLMGHGSMLIPKAIGYHIGSATTGGQHSDFAVYHGHRNMVWTFIKDMPGTLFWMFLPLHIMLNLVSLIWFTLRGQGRIILHAKYDAVKGITSVWRKRKEIQQTRQCSVGEIWRALDKRLIIRSRDKGLARME